MRRPVYYVHLVKNSLFVFFPIQMLILEFRTYDVSSPGVSSDDGEITQERHTPHERLLPSSLPPDHDPRDMHPGPGVVWCRQTVFTEPAARWLLSGDQATHKIRRS